MAKVVSQPGLQYSTTHRKTGIKVKCISMVPWDKAGKIRDGTFLSQIDKQTWFYSKHQLEKPRPGCKHSSPTIQDEDLDWDLLILNQTWHIRWVSSHPVFLSESVVLISISERGWERLQPPRKQIEASLDPISALKAHHHLNLGRLTCWRDALRGIKQRFTHPGSVSDREQLSVDAKCVWGWRNI